MSVHQYAQAPPPVSSHAHPHSYASSPPNASYYQHSAPASSTVPSIHQHAAVAVPSIHQKQPQASPPHAQFYGAYPQQQHPASMYPAQTYGSPLHMSPLTAGTHPMQQPQQPHPMAMHMHPHAQMMHSPQPPQTQPHPSPQPSHYPPMPSGSTPLMLTPQQQQAMQLQRAQQQQMQATHAHPPPVHTPQPAPHVPGSSIVMSTSAPSLSVLHHPHAPAHTYAQAAIPELPPAVASSDDPTPSLLSVLQDLDSRFLVNVPDEELSSFERIMFQLQQAHWFYLDFYSDRYARLPKLGYKTFCENYFKHIPSFRKHLSKFEAVYASFNNYLNAVPVCGAILLNPEMTHVVMVRSYVGNSWGFPRGKLDANEDEITCCIREVEEEIGFDCRAWFKGYEIVAPGQSRQSSENRLARQSSSTSTSSTSSSALQAQQPSYFECHTAKKATRLYVLQGVPRNTKFETRTRKEIGKIAWIPISALPNAQGKPMQQSPSHGPQPPEPTGNPALDAQNLAAFQQAHPAAAASAESAGKYKFGNAVGGFGSKLRTFIKKIKSGQITGYGAYETAAPQQSQAQPSQQAQQKKNKNNNADGAQSARKASQQQPQQQQAQQSGKDRRHSAAPQKSLSFAEASLNAETFASSSAPSHSNGGGSAAGWSPEQMFAANARLGVVTTVQEEKLQLPAHLDAKLNAFLGRKSPQQQPQQSQNNNAADASQQQQGSQPSEKQRRKAAKKAAANAANASVVTSPSDAVSHSTSAPIAIPNGKSSSSSSSSSLHVPAPELDFGHNPYVSFANMNLHQQGAVVPSSSAPATASALEATPAVAAAPSAAAASKSAQKPKQQKGKNKQQQSQGGEKPAEVIPQYRIQKRPTPASAAAADAPAPASAPSAPVDTSSPAAFKFDVSSIMQPLM